VEPPEPVPVGPLDHLTKQRRGGRNRAHVEPVLSLSTGEKEEQHKKKKKNKKNKRQIP
jgi:hypothetical protein